MAQIGGHDLWIIARIQAQQSQTDVSLGKVLSHLGPDTARRAGDEYCFAHGF
jgi:hypothetical protein